MRVHQAGTEVELVGLGKEEYNGVKATCEAPHSVDRRVVSLADGTKITVKPTNMKGFEDFGKILIIAGSHGGVAGPVAHRMAPHGTTRHCVLYRDTHD